MVDAVTVVPPATDPFDTAAIQIAQARAKAITDHVNELTYLQDVAKANDVVNAQVLTGTAAAVPGEPLPTADLFGLDASGNPTTDPSNLAFLTEFGSNQANTVTNDSVKAQQLHDAGILQRDAVLLEQAAFASNHIPLSNSASTVDLSLAAQRIAGGPVAATINNAPLLTSAQLTQIGNILQPIANAPLTPALLQQIQLQLSAGQNPIQLSLNTIALVMNFIASMQPSPYHLTENAVAQVDSQAVAAVSAVDGVAVEDSAIR